MPSFGDKLKSAIQVFRMVGCAVPCPRSPPSRIAILAHLFFVAECAVKLAFNAIVYRGQAAHQEIKHGNRSIVVSAFAGA